MTTVVWLQGQPNKSRHSSQPRVYPHAESQNACGSLFWLPPLLLHLNWLHVSGGTKCTRPISSEWEWRNNELTEQSAPSKDDSGRAVEGYKSGGLCHSRIENMNVSVFDECEIVKQRTRKQIRPMPFQEKRHNSQSDVGNDFGNVATRTMKCRTSGGRVLIENNKKMTSSQLTTNVKRQVALNLKQYLNSNEFGNRINLYISNKSVANATEKRTKSSKLWSDDKVQQSERT